MNKTACSLLALLLLTPTLALAAKTEGPKARTMAKYDLNHDGKLDADEITALRKDFAAAPKGDLARFDTDHDGKLSDEEIAKIIPGSGKKSGKTDKSADRKKEAKPADASSETKAPDDKK